jgi:hypothetical protein
MNSDSEAWVDRLAAELTPWPQSARAWAGVTVQTTTSTQMVSAIQ